MSHFLNMRILIKLFIVSIFFSLIGCFLCLSNYPPYIDFDAATEGTFINSYVHQGRYDYYFNLAKQKYSTVTFAAQRLPFTLAIAPIVRLFCVEPFNMPEFFKVLAAVFAILGCCCATTLMGFGDSGSGCGNVAEKEKNDTWIARAFVVAFSIGTPALFIFIRGGIAFNLMAFFLFWLTIALFVYYCRTDRIWPLYAMSFVVAYFLLNKYPPLAGLPLTALSILVFYKKIFISAKNIHCYLSLFLCLGIYVASDRIIGEFVAGDYETYSQRRQEQTQDRQFVFSVERQILNARFLDKVEKLVNQHILFKVDKLGDRTHEDDVYTLGAIHYPFLCMLPLLVIGAIKGEKRQNVVDKDDNTYLFLLITVTYLFVFLTISFPEGRYITPVIPCYAYFIWCGVTRFFSSVSARCGVAAFLLFCHAGSTYWLTATVYNDYMHEVWKSKNGIKELAMVLPPKIEGAKEIIGIPWSRNNRAWHYFALVTGLRAEWLTISEFSTAFDSVSKSDTEGLPHEGKVVFYFMESTEDSKLSRELLAKNFKVIRHFYTQFKKEPRILLQYVYDGNTVLKD